MIVVERPRLYVAFGRRVKELRERLGISQRELARRANMSETYPSQIEKGSAQPSDDALRSLARVLGAEYEELSALAHLPDNQNRDPEPPRYLADVASTLTAALPYEIAIYDGEPIHGADFGVPIQVAYLPRLPERRRDALIGLYVKGDCMEPNIRDGDLVIIDREAEPASGKVVAILTETGWALRRMKGSGKNVSFVCDNPKSAEADAKPLPDSPVYRVIESRKAW